MADEFPWLEIASKAASQWATPLYVAAWEPVSLAMEELRPLQSLAVPIRHWLSVKTQPVWPLLETWRHKLPYGAEVISRFELYGALAAGFTPKDIVINGLAKHTWLPASLAGFNVHFDSLSEIDSLTASTDMAGARLGARCLVPAGLEPHDPTIGGQFGMDGAELRHAVRRLRRLDLGLEGLHFHLRSNIRDAEIYRDALERVMAMAAHADMRPVYVDCGGGLPVPGEGTLEGGEYISRNLSISTLVAALSDFLVKYPSIKELWFENGRFLTARSAALVLRVTDVKERGGCRYLICDGGRTNNALPADWEWHRLETIPARTGPSVTSAICGPTCTSYDRLALRPMADDIVPGDHLVWLNAGAYHLSWETRFSHGWANVVWCDPDRTLRLARPAETPPDWWRAWTGAQRGE